MKGKSILALYKDSNAIIFTKNGLYHLIEFDLNTKIVTNNTEINIEELNSVE